MPSLKLIVTSKANLQLKYQNNFRRVQKLFSELQKADKQRDLTTKVVYIDNAASARQFGIQAVTSMKEKNCKDTIDALWQKHQPAYIVLFGAEDIFPFQNLDNELYDPDIDSDETVPSDLPYACEAPYSKRIASFTNPTRVVGRLPDVPQHSDLEYVETLIRNSINHRELPLEDYMDYFCVTAQVWTQSTQQSIKNIFGNYKKVLDCPPKGTGYNKQQLAPLSHFYNCHGALADPKYYGQKGNTFPVSLNAAKDLDGNISKGTLVAAECCYGAQLLDPSDDGLSIASKYLLHNASSFLGSSTIAYGPPKGQGLADLICQYFMKAVHCGASTGRALLEARQKFLNVSGPALDAHELKTLAQFYILGDPSLTLVKTMEPKDASNTVQNRRMNLYTKGMNIGQSVNPSKKVKGKELVRRKDLKSVLKENGFEDVKGVVFESKAGSAQTTVSMKNFAGGKTRFYTFEKTKRTKGSIPNIEVLVVKEHNNEILGWRLYVSR